MGAESVSRSVRLSMHFLVEAIGLVLLRLLIWLVLFPVVWVIATPIVLIAAAFARMPYWSAVRELYGSVSYIWNEWGSGW